jgi:hypothetical protein
MERTFSAASPDVLAEFVGVMGKLKAIIETENDFLNRGLPATLLATTVRKGALSREYAQLGTELVDEAVDHILRDPGLHGKLLAAGAELQALSAENRDLLERALTATRRRVDAVMQAVRDCDAPAADQPADGGAPSAHR